MRVNLFGVPAQKRWGLRLAPFLLALFAALPLPAQPYIGWGPLEATNASFPTLPADIVLTPTYAAPPDAKGFVQFEPGNQPYSLPSAMTFRTERLRPGIYSLTVIRKSDSAPALLAWISIANLAARPDRQAGDDNNQRYNTYPSQILETRSQVELPSDFRITDIGQFLLTDVFGNPVLLSPPSP